MDRHDMIQLAQRMLGATDNDARLREIVRLAPDRTLGRAGLSHRRSAAYTVLTTTGALTVGAAIGATVALLLAPGSGKDLRTWIGKEARRLSDELTKLRDERAAKAAAKGTAPKGADGAPPMFGETHAARDGGSSAEAHPTDGKRSRVHA